MNLENGNCSVGDFPTLNFEWWRTCYNHLQNIMLIILIGAKADNHENPKILQKLKI